MNGIRMLSVENRGQANEEARWAHHSNICLVVFSFILANICTGIFTS